MIDVRFRPILIAGAVLWLPASGAGAGPCILPVTGEEPLSVVEAEQPGRLAWNPLVLPGYEGLLLRPINRPSDGHFYQIVGTTYRKMAVPAAGSSILDEETLVAKGGDLFLPEVGGRLWHLPQGLAQWQEVDVGNGLSITAHDAGSQDLYAGFGTSSPVLRWDGTAFVASGPMPTAFGDAVSSLAPEGVPRAILTLPKAGGTFAVAMDWFNEDWRSLWFRPSGGDWTPVATKADLDRFAPGLRLPGPFGDSNVSEDGTVVRFFAGHPREASVLLRKRANGWVLDQATPFQQWVTHRGSGVRLAWSGAFSQDLTERALLFFERSVDVTQSSRSGRKPPSTCLESSKSRASIRCWWKRRRVGRPLTAARSLTFRGLGWSELGTVPGSSELGRWC
jgi:hypothetical protein